VLTARGFELGLHVNIAVIAPDYFRTLRIPLLAGRDFSGSDRTGSPNVVIVSRKLADTMWPHEYAVGKRIAYPQWGGARRPPFEVVGVAGDVKHRSLAGETSMMLYVPLLEEYASRTNIVVRMRKNAEAGFAGIRQEVAAIDKNLPLYISQTGEQHIADSLWQQRMATSWTGAFSLAALALAAMGLYVVIAQSVAQRTREVGIRVALGASQSGIAWLIMRQGFPLAFAGIAGGVPAAVAFNRLIQGRLDGVTATGQSLASYLAIAILLVLVMLAACWIPVRRATRVNPIQALRSE
jgi:hypothetical protein